MRFASAVRFDASPASTKSSYGNNVVATVTRRTRKFRTPDRVRDNGPSAIPRSQRVLRPATGGFCAQRGAMWRKFGVRPRQHMTRKCLIDRSGSTTRRSRRPSKLLGRVDDSERPSRFHNLLIRLDVRAELRTPRKALVARFDGWRPEVANPARDVTLCAT